MHRNILLKRFGRSRCPISKYRLGTGKVKSSELVKILQKDGWFVVRQAGSHMIMEHPIKKGKIICPFHSSHEVGKGLAIKILKVAGLKIKE
jgi:predicted RNA binding protein YcfA (HicA-like mRNA interferase family)